MTNHAEVSETSLAREIFGPLGGIVEIGAVIDAGTSTPLAQVSVGEFTARNHEKLANILRTVQTIGNFHPSTMALVDELGWHADHEITAPSLLLWSGGIEEYSPDLGNPRSVRRMTSTGSDLQLVYFTHSLVGVAVTLGQPVATSSQLIVEAVRRAAKLLGADEPGAVWCAYRMWRASVLPTVLMPASGSPNSVKIGYRLFAHALEDLLRDQVIESSRLQIYEVESSSELGGVCIARCVGGVVRPGQTFVPVGISEESAEGYVTLTAIERYGENVDFFDPPHSARVHFSGRSVGNLIRGSILTRTAS